MTPEIDRRWQIESRAAPACWRAMPSPSWTRCWARATASRARPFTVLNAPLLARDPTDRFPDGGHAGRRAAGVARGRATSPVPPTRAVSRSTASTGTITLPPSLLQPDGRMRRFGEVPPRGSVLRFSRYQHGGGLHGNVGVGKIEVMKTAVPYVARVRNYRAGAGRPRRPEPRRRQGAGGRAAAIGRARRHRRGFRVPHDAGAWCGARALPGAGAGTRPPRGHPPGPGLRDRPAGRRGFGSGPTPGNWCSPTISDAGWLDLSGSALRDWRRRRSPIAAITWVAASVDLLVSADSHPAVAGEVQREAERALYAYLNPFTGGPARDRLALRPRPAPLGALRPAAADSGRRVHRVDPAAHP